MSRTHPITVYLETEAPVPPSVLFRPTTAGYLDFFDPTQTSVYQPDRRFAKPLNDKGYNDTKTLGPNNTAIIEISRSKIETLGLIAKAFNAISIGGKMLIWGSKTDGIGSVLKQLKPRIQILEVTSISHGKLLILQKSTEDTLPSWDDALVQTQKPHGFTTAPGIFSPEKIDKGSACLAPLLKDRLKGKVADFGAGWGWLAHQALASNEQITSLDLVEVDRIALDCARVNVPDPRAHFHWLDITQDKIPDRYDAIIMNPPFHQSRASDLALGQRFIERAASALAPKGELWMVANTHLAYEKTLQSCFRRVEQLQQNGGFKVLHCRTPR